MRTRFIHDKFTLDVSHLELSWTEENSWFQDEFFLVSSFPFDIDYAENPYFEQFKHYNLETTDTHYQGKLEKDGRIEEAILELEEAADKLRVTIRYGIEAFPNWEKKLSELELEVVLPGGGSMIALAQNTISKTYPETNFNFPAVHSKYYDGAPNFESFQGTINKRKNGSFVYNTFDEFGTPQIQNANIVYPLPYHLYVLKSAIEDAGYVLKGDVLTDPDLIDAVVVPGKKIIEFEGFPAPLEWTVSRAEIYKTESWPGNQFDYFESTQEFNKRGSFHFTGTIDDEVVFLEIRLNGQLIYSHQGNLNVNFWFITTEENNEFVCLAVSHNMYSADAAKFILYPLELHDENGDPLPMIANFSNVQLADKLPDMTVGEFIKFHKSVKNYDFALKNDNEIWMNLVQNEVEDSDYVDISEHDLKRPQRKYEQAKSFLLKYDIDSEEYPYDQLYADRTGYYVNEFSKSENTTEITINGIPLPIDVKDGIHTAVQISDDAAKLLLTKYNGLTNGENWAQPMPNLNVVNLYLKFWQKWLTFMIHAVKFVWTVKDLPNLLIKIKPKSKLFAYNNLLFVHTLNRRRKKDIEEVEIEAYTTKI